MGNFLNNVKNFGITKPLAFQPKVNEGNNFWKQPSVSEKPLGSLTGTNPLGISAPNYGSRTVAEDGYTQIAMGYKGNGDRFVSSGELAYMQEYKGEGRNLFTLA